MALAARFGHRHFWAIMQITGLLPLIIRTARRPGNWLVIGILAMVIAAVMIMDACVRQMTDGALPFRDVDQLISVHNTKPGFGSGAGNVAVPDYFERRGIAGVESAAIYTYTHGNLQIGTDPQRLAGLVASPSLFTTLGLKPELGRLLNDQDAVENGAKSIVLSYAAWQKYFAGDAKWLGAQINLDGQSRTIVGVLDRNAPYINMVNPPEYFLPEGFSAKQRSDAERGADYWMMILRLAPGANAEQFATTASSLAIGHYQRQGKVGQDYLDSSKLVVTTKPYRDFLFGDAIKSARSLQLGIFALLLIAFANLAILLSAQFVQREGEKTLKQALGASHGQLMKLELLEGTIVALTATLIAGGVASLLLPIVHAMVRPSDFVPVASLTARSWLLACMISIILGLLASMIGSKLAQRGSLVERLKQLGRSGTGSRSLSAMRQYLSSAQFALATALLAGALLLGREFYQSSLRGNGFDEQNVLTFNTVLSGPRYDTVAKEAQFQRAVQQGISALPGVESVVLTQHLPFNGQSWRWGIYSEVNPGVEVQLNMIYTGPKFFQTLNVPMRAGRDFNDGDVDGKAKVAILDEAAAMRLFGSKDVVGKTVRNDDETWQVIAVVANVQRIDPGQQADAGSIYFSTYQNSSFNTHIAIRAANGRALDINMIKAVVHQIDPALPLFDVKSLVQLKQNMLSAKRLTATMAAVFAISAIGLCVFGTFGVLAFNTERRRSEFGVRMALGANQRGIARMVVTSGIRLSIIGIGVGVPLALLLQWSMRRYFPNVLDFDWYSIAIACVCISVSAVIASAVPAWRATRVSPVQSIRST